MSVRPSVRNLQVKWVSIIGLSSNYTRCFIGWFCMSGWNKFFDPPFWPPLGPIFLCFRGIFAHTSGFTGGVILLVYASVYVFLGSLRHSPGGIFSLFQNIRFWALGRGLKIGGLKPFKYAFFNTGMLYRHVVYHMKCIVKGNQKLYYSNIFGPPDPPLTPFDPLWPPFDPPGTGNRSFYNHSHIIYR